MEFPSSAAGGARQLFLTYTIVWFLGPLFLKWIFTSLNITKFTGYIKIWQSIVSIHYLHHSYCSLTLIIWILKWNFKQDPVATKPRTTLSHVLVRSFLKPEFSKTKSARVFCKSNLHPNLLSASNACHIFRNDNSHFAQTRDYNSQVLQ